jgi:hypothetical protein
MKFAIPWHEVRHTISKKERAEFIQFNESATDDKAETACATFNGLAYINIEIEIKGHTRDGATSEIMMNGTGPSPMAKDLESRVSGKGRAKKQILA